MSKLINGHTEKYVTKKNKMFNTHSRLDSTRDFKNGMHKTAKLLENRINKCKTLKDIARVTVKFLEQFR